MLWQSYIKTPWRQEPHVFSSLWPLWHLAQCLTYGLCSRSIFWTLPVPDQWSNYTLRALSTGVLMVWVKDFYILLISKEERERIYKVWSVQISWNRYKIFSGCLFFQLRVRTMKLGKWRIYQRAYNQVVIKKNSYEFLVLWAFKTL